MAVQGSQDLKIFSSVRPLQIQRSFEGPPEATDIVEAVTRDVTIEKRSSVTITSSQTSSSTVMSAVHQGADGVTTSPLSAASGTVTIKAASTTTTSQVSPGTVIIRSSGAAPATVGAASTSPGAGSQNVVILRNPSSVAQTGPSPGQVVAGQGTIVIKSAATPPVTATVVHPNAQSRIIISPAPITQSRITITGGSAPVQTAPEATEVVSHETQAAPAPAPAPPQGRRSSLTIKAAPSPTSPTPATVAASPINSPASIQPPQSVAVSDEPPSSHLTATEHAPQEVAVTEHRTPEPTTQPPTAAAPVTAIEDLSEKIHPKKPVGPTLEEVLDKFDISKVFYIALTVLITVVICILSEGEIPLSWLLAAISVISLGSFIAFRL